MARARQEETLYDRGNTQIGLRVITKKKGRWRAGGVMAPMPSQWLQRVPRPQRGRGGHQLACLALQARVVVHRILQDQALVRLPRRARM